MNRSELVQTLLRTVLEGDANRRDHGSKKKNPPDDDPGSAFPVGKNVSLRHKDSVQSAC